MATSMMLTRKVSAAAGTFSIGRRSSCSRGCRLAPMRAVDENGADAPKPSGSTVFYAGKAYTEAEWQQAVDSGAVVTPGPSSSSAAKAITIVDVMAFAGPAPEIINGRLAMLGVVAALAAEFSSGEGVLKQWAEEPTLIALTFILFAAGSLVPLLRGASAEQKLGPFTPQAEMLNGRAAMLGFASLLAIEAVRGAALF